MSSRLSPDGLYYWDGSAWISTLSPDGRHRWNGAAWVPSAGPVYVAPAAVLREPTPWTRPIQLAVAAWFALGALASLTLPIWLTGMMTQVVNQSIQQQQQLNPEASPLPADFTGVMTSMMTGMVWFGVILGFVLYGAGCIGALKRWTWLYYVTLVWLGLVLLSLPLNIANLVSGRVLTGSTSLNLPTWYLYLGVVLGVVQAGLFVWMLIALVRYGPWAMRRTAPT
jgi:hypothetical protein